jgi:CBS-domain-containing membrane protein
MKFRYRRTATQNWHILWQSLIVFTVMLGFMFAIKYYTNADEALSAIGATSLGATAFLVFVAHDSAMARSRRIMSSYFIGLVMGVIGSAALEYLGHCEGFHCQFANLDVVISALTAMLAMILMLLLSSEHPPAVGIAIGLVLRTWDIPVLLIVAGTVLAIVVLKEVLRPWLLNLL